MNAEFIDLYRVAARREKSTTRRARCLLMALTSQHIKFSMKRLIPLTLALVFSLAGLAQNQKPVDSRITDVTLFLQGAQVFHEADISLKSGENVILLTDLTQHLDASSIQVEGNKDYTIINVKHSINYLSDKTTSPEIKAVIDSLDDLQFKLLERQSMKSVYIQERDMLYANKSIKGDNVVLVSEDLAEMADFFRSRLKEIEYKLLELNQAEKQLNKDIQRLQNQLNSLNARKQANPSEIAITIACDKATSSKLKLSYIANNAGWIPTYDLRAKDINEPIELVYKAKVYQATGTDWNDVKLTLSTGNPSIGGQSPVMYPWFINIYDPRPVAIFDKKERARAEEVPSVAYGSRPDNMYEDAISVADLTVQQENVVSVEFAIGVPYDVPSNGQYYDVEMQRKTLSASYTYFTAPKLDTDAFLRAQVTDWMQYSLLPGESNIFFKGTFVGHGYIDPALANDTLNISLGRDRAIQVERKMLNDYCKTSTLGGNTKTTKAFEISVTNTKKSAVKLLIEDQIPISQNADVIVELEESSGATLDATTGKLTWSVDLAPGETMKKNLIFSVKYPKKKFVSGL
ncbi:MAG: hypothetical protein RL220_1004 [Bacteroidota bacterium]